MAFGSGFITGLASSFDKMLQLDMQRNQDRLSRAEQYASTRRLQKLERAESQGRDLKKNLRELAAITGSHTRAGMAAEGVGGTSEAIAELVKDLKMEQKKLGAGFNVSDFIDFSGEKTIKEPRTLVDNFSRFREDIDFSVEVPEGMTKATGLMGKFGMGLKRDVKADVEGMIDVPEEFTAPRDTATLPTGKVSFDKGYQAREFADQFDTDTTDPKYKNGGNMMAHAGQLMLSLDPNSPEYENAEKMYKMGLKIVQDAKADENSDASNKALTPAAAIALVNQTKRTFYNPENSKLEGDSIVPDFKGTKSYINYFPAQENVMSGLKKLNETAYKNDKTIGFYAGQEEVAFGTAVDGYLRKFGQDSIPENKAAKFKTETINGKTTRVFDGYVTPTPFAQAQREAEDGEHKIGDILNIEQDGAQMIAVWTGTQWSN